MDNATVSLNPPCVMLNIVRKEQDTIPFCFISEEMFYDKYKGHTQTMCGLCLNLHGASQMSSECMVVGTFHVNSTSQRNQFMIGDLMFDVSKVVLLDEEVIARLSSSTAVVNALIGEVTIKKELCYLTLLPFIIPKRHQDNMVQVQAVGVQTPIHILQINKQEYYMDDTSNFFIPFGKYVLYAFDTLGNNSVKFNTKGWDFTTRLPAESTFVIESNDTQCEYRPSNVIYNKETFDGTLSWAIYAYSLEKDLYFQLHPDASGIKFKAVSTVTVINIRYLSTLIFSKHFSEITATFIHDGKYHFQYSQLGMGAVKSNTTEKQFLCSPLDVISSETIDSATGNHILKLKASMDHRCRNFGNFIMFVFAASEGAEVTITDLTFVRRQSQKRENECSSKQFLCQNHECNYMFNSCTIECGYCRAGFTCSESGSCLVDDNNNIRDFNLGVELTLLVVFLIALL
ncbi:hypothetical protein EIN_226210 [Entamoeba invadens IP1]|uniref:Uncharacterized protein n=1 Tax=Entamoeba invadens IP1 TaxID=370355 RepID=A0A0A1U8F0_ENTIV|nr:hypothetical protein EIN_226210 [Entamoeba invadens IP1]ELP88258.1 hypothetical protein EIN_226210 [Entamoeba invadens IP1]|eukprot:XP_004255029.1 hypothetical protein EIN_226210 [Entamoeba invadens IP1]